MIRPIYIICYVGCIALAAQLTIDLNLANVSIPVSGQTFAILTGAIFLKPRESFLAIMTYCGLGILGLPVFSDGNGGWQAFSGGSLGYFVGFLLAAVAVSYLATKGWADSFIKLLAITTFGTFIILFFGTANLSIEHGIQKGIDYGFTPFLLGGAVKIIIGVLVVVLIQKLELLPPLEE